MKLVKRQKSQLSTTSAKSENGNYIDENEMPLTGVSLKYLKKWFKKQKVTKDETGHDICVRIKNSSQNSDTFCESLLRKSPKAIKEKADVFVSYTWSYKFSTVLAALENYQRNSNKKDLFVWIDLLVYDFTDPSDKHAEHDSVWLQHTFHQGIHDIGHTLVVLSIFDNMALLKRTWCIWEIYGSIKHGINIDICLDQDEENACVSSIVKHFEKFEKMINNIDVEKSEMFNPKDRTRLLDIMNTTIGFRKINKKVQLTIGKWLAEAGLKQYENEKDFTEYPPLMFSNFILSLGKRLMDQDFNEKSLSLLQKSLDMLESNAGPKNIIAHAISQIGFCMRKAGERSNSLIQFQGAFEMFKNIYGMEHPKVADSLSNLGNTFYEMGKYEPALEKLNESLDIYKKIHGMEHLLVASSLKKIGKCFQNLGDYKMALEKFEETLEIYKTLYGPDHQLVATTLGTMADCFQSLGEYKSAFEKLNESLEMYRKIYNGKNHPLIAAGLDKLAGHYHRLGDAKMALEKYEEALEIRQALHGINSPSVAANLHNLACVLRDLGEYKYALETSKQALRICKDTYGMEHPAVESSGSDDTENYF